VYCHFLMMCFPYALVLKDFSIFKEADNKGPQR
jgi:hypothetical protein